jgi:hypothetical protein
MFQQDKEKLEGLFLQPKWHSSFRELAGFTVQFKSAEG